MKEQSIKIYQYNFSVNNDDIVGGKLQGPH